jgi:hypothetical protein
MSNPRSERATPRDKGLRSFLSINKCWIQRDSETGAELTHTLLDGGRISLPDHLQTDFWTAYDCDLTAGRRLSVVERRSSPVFRMHLDVDLKEMRGENDMKQLLLVVGRAVKSALAPSLPMSRVLDEGLMLVACAVMRESSLSRDRLGKGLHLVWPDLSVDERAAFLLRSHIARECEKSFGDWNVDWEVVLDPATLRAGGGLRAIGSKKVTRCESCGGNFQLRDICRECEGGYVAKEGVYWPWGAWPISPTTVEFLTGSANRVHTLRRCSVRLPSNATLQPLVIEYLSSRDTSVDNFRRVRPRISSDRVTVGLSTDLQEALKIVLGAVHPNFAELRIRDAVFERGRWLINVSGRGSRFCINKGSEHTSQNVFFICEERGLRQCCYSRKAEARRFGPCGTFASIPHPLPENIKQLLEERLPTPVCLAPREASSPDSQEAAAGRSFPEKEWSSEEESQVRRDR